MPNESSRWVKQYTITLPTWRLGLVLVLFTLTVTLIMARNLGYFLAPHSAHHSGLLVVEGWLSDEALHRAFTHFTNHKYDMVVTTGGPILGDCDEHKNYAMRAQAVLIEAGIPADKIEAAPAPASAQDRTFLSGVMLREWLLKQTTPYEYADLYTGSVHARRSQYLYQLAVGSRIQIGSIPSPPEEFTLEGWWRNSAGAKTVLIEFIGWSHAQCCFFPGQTGSLNEKWGPGHDNEN